VGRVHILSYGGPAQSLGMRRPERHCGIPVACCCSGQVQLADLRSFPVAQSVTATAAFRAALLGREGTPRYRRLCRRTVVSVVHGWIPERSRTDAWLPNPSFLWQPRWKPPPSAIASPATIHAGCFSGSDLSAGKFVQKPCHESPASPCHARFFPFRNVRTNTRKISALSAL